MKTIKANGRGPLKPPVLMRPNFRGALVNALKHPVLDAAGQARAFFCRGCGARQQSILVPDGWYTLRRHVHGGSVGLGAYCSPMCFAHQLPRLVAMEENQAVRGEGR